MSFCLFCKKEHSQYFLCKDRIDARLLYINNISIDKEGSINYSLKKFLLIYRTHKKLLQPKITTYFRPKSEMPQNSQIVENSEPILIQSEETSVQENYSIKCLRPRIKKCFKCQNEFGECRCGKENKNNDVHKVVEATMNDPKIKSHENQVEKMTKFLISRVSEENPDLIPPEKWMTWIIEFSEGKGRCTYRSGEKGICPKTARVYFNLALKVVSKEWGLDLKQKFPHFKIFVPRWQAVINKENLYQRNQAKYFSKQDVRDYMLMFEEIMSAPSKSEAYYAALASVILSVSILFAGCRLGALLDIRLGAVQFITVESGDQPQAAVALYPGGSKTDPLNQRTSPIVFGELPEREICPIRAFLRWLKVRGVTRKDNKLEGPPSDFLFPLFSANKKIQTGHFTKVVKNLEKKFGNQLPKFKAHTGRFTITTLALFAKNDTGDKLIQPLTLEHQLSWVRNTAVLPGYMGHNSTCVKGGFFDTISRIRKEGLEDSIDENAVKTFSSNNFNSDIFQQLENKRD